LNERGSARMAATIGRCGGTTAAVGGVRRV
jgi:hypothetical protein